MKKDSAPAHPARKTPRRIHVVSKEERAERVALAKSFLKSFGRDDDVDTHHSSLERLR